MSKLIEFGRSSMSPAEFAKEVVEAAQAVLAMQLIEGRVVEMSIETEQLGKKFKLTFEEL